MTRTAAEYPFYWKVGALPFVFSITRNATNAPEFPDVLDFSLAVDPDTGLLVQAMRDGQRGILEKAYRAGSVMAGAADDSETGRGNTEHFLRFVQSAARRNSLQGLEMLEIGCGKGYLLSRFRDLGAEVCGIEPGAHGQAGAERLGLRVVRDFFPSESAPGPFDAVALYMVYEHLYDPIQALISVRGALKPDGWLFLSVEDEEDYIEAGDPSILFHEHFSYLTATTLEDVLRFCGFQSIQIVKPDISKILYAAARTGTAATPPAERVRQRAAAARRYRIKVEESVSFVRGYVDKLNRARESLGVYVPGRAVNLLSMAGQEVRSLRFFDDDPSLKGCFFPGWRTPIESRADLVDNPPDCLFVMSASFGDRIIAGFPPRLRSSTRILSWTDIFLNRGRSTMDGPTRDHDLR